MKEKLIQAGVVWGCYRLRKYSPDAFGKENPEIAAVWYPGKRDALVAAFRNRYPHMDMLKIYPPAGWKAAGYAGEAVFLWGEDCQS